MLRTATLLAGLVAAGTAFAQNDQANTASVAMMNKDGQPAGSVTLTGTPNGVLLRPDLTGLPAGVHGFHIHETGECDAAGGFESAGGHFAPGGNSHGFKVEGGPHAGDMPNQRVDEGGNLQSDIFNAEVTLGDGADSIRGLALIVHEGADDYESQPSGDAGSRLACGVIE